MLGRLLDFWKNGGADTMKPRTGTSGNRTDVIPLDDINCLVKAKHGWFLANRYDHFIGQALIQYGEYSELEQEFLLSLVKSGDRVIEVGANIGTHTIGLAKAVGLAGGIVAVEPQPAIFHVLCANVALNCLNNVWPLSIGCGAARGRMAVPAIDYYSRATHNSGGVSLDATMQGVPIDVVPVDELVDLGTSAHLLKIDVEGMERDVLEGASRFVERHRPLLYVENDRPDKSKPLVEWIMAAEYRLWWHAPPLFNPENFFGTSSNLYGPTVSINMLCVPREKPLSVTSRLQELTDPGYHPLAR